MKTRAATVWEGWEKQVGGWAFHTILELKENGLCMNPNIFLDNLTHQVPR